jgi:hypothetical protein
MAIQWVPIHLSLEFRDYLTSVKGDLSYEKYLKIELGLQEKSASEKATKRTGEPVGLDFIVEDEE